MDNLSCSFTGRRILEPHDICKIDCCLQAEIEHLIKKGYKIFLTGGALGFDTIAAQAILKLRETYKQIKLFLIIPCPEYTKNWDKSDKIKFEEIKKQSDEILYTSKTKIRGCNHIRNRYLIDNCNKCIAYCNSQTGGTAYTVKYAIKKGLQIINISDL